MPPAVLPPEPTVATAPPALPGRVPHELSGVLALSTEAVVSVDHECHILLFNRGAELVFGYSAAEVLGAPLSLLVPERDRAAHAAAVAEFVEGAASERPMASRGIVRGLRRDGTEFPAEASIARTGDGADRVLTVLLRDISERQRAEQELKLLQRIALSMSVADDPGAALEHVLAEVGRVTGWVTGEAWLPDAQGRVLRRAAAWSNGEPVAERFNEASRAFAFAPGNGLVGTVWQRGEPVWLENVAESPAFRRVELARELGLRAGVGFPVLAGEEVVAVIVFFHREARQQERRMVTLVSAVAAQLGAVVRRKLAEDALARKAAELARTNAELAQFAYVASHDLQEPLRMVASYTQLLARRYRDRLDNDAQEFIDYAVEGVTRMQRLILDLLTLSNVGVGEPDGTTADTTAAARAALAELQPALDAAGAEISLTSLPPVRVEMRALMLVFQSLIDNALKFRAAAAPHIRISAERQDDVCVVSVADNGIGIAPEYHERIFTVFQRLHTRDRYPGNGVGLALCRKIVERHGGRIWVESTAGAGAVFRLSLPAA